MTRKSISIANSQWHSVLALCLHGHRAGDLAHFPLVARRPVLLVGVLGKLVRQQQVAHPQVYLGHPLVDTALRFVGFLILLAKLLVRAQGLAPPLLLLIDSAYLAEDV